MSLFDALSLLLVFAVIFTATAMFWSKISSVEQVTSTKQVEASETKKAKPAGKKKPKQGHALSAANFSSLLTLVRSYPVEPEFYPRFFELSVISALLSTPYGWIQSLLFGKKIRETKITKAPIIILGNFRSGTTHLHYCLAQNPEMGFADTFACVSPLHFIVSKRLGMPSLFSGIIPKKRLMDNVEFGFGVPMEDEFAMIKTLKSYMCALCFPSTHFDHFFKYMNFDGVKDEDRESWKSQWYYFLQALTFDNGGKRLVLKSPTHTSKIKAILEIFPDAKFVHINRNPWHVIQSQQKKDSLSDTTILLQRGMEEGRCLNDETLVHQFKVMYDTFFEERELIPAGNYHDIKYEDLEQDPVGEIKNLYSALGLEGYDEYKPYLEAYLSTVKNYSKNKHEPLPQPLSLSISSSLSHYIDAFGYAHEDPYDN